VSNNISFLCYAYKSLILKKKIKNELKKDKKYIWNLLKTICSNLLFGLKNLMKLICNKLGDENQHIF
jgi:hypothetical protein